jgi:hypothetical protein
VALLEGKEIARLVVGHAVDPAPEEDADPFDGEGSDGGVGGLGPLGRAGVGRKARAPEGSGDGFFGPFDEGLAQEGGARPNASGPSACCRRVR